MRCLLLVALLVGIDGAAFADTVRHGFNVIVHNRAGVHIGTPLKAARAVSSGTTSRTVVIPNALTIRAPGVSGYVLRFRVLDRAVTSVDIVGLPSTVHLSNESADLFVPASAAGPRAELTLSYAITYAAGARPARRSAPVEVTFLP